MYEIPACAGMTSKFPGMTSKFPGMTRKFAGMTDYAGDRYSPATYSPA
ncbi:hypothetical protein [Glaciecola sp. KUL10]|nr:hypothetical protein [Glaciecola sp. KUL10]